MHEEKEAGRVVGPGAAMAGREAAWLCLWAVFPVDPEWNKRKIGHFIVLSVGPCACKVRNARGRSACSNFKG